jgi:hypothetical protein
MKTDAPPTHGQARKKATARLEPACRVIFFMPYVALLPDARTLSRATALSNARCSHVITPPPWARTSGTCCGRRLAGVSNLHGSHPLPLRSPTSLQVFCHSLARHDLATVAGTSPHLLEGQPLVDDHIMSCS